MIATWQLQRRATPVLSQLFGLRTCGRVALCCLPDTCWLLPSPVQSKRSVGLLSRTSKGQALLLVFKTLQTRVP